MAFPTTGLLARYEALSEVGYTDGDPLATIADQSGAGRDMLQTTAAKKPTFRSGVVNGLPTYRVDGVDDRAVWDAPMSGGHTPTAWSISAVISSGVSEASSRKWPFAYDRGTAQLFALTEGATSGEYGTFVRSSGGTVQQSTSGVDTTGFCVLTVTWDGSTVRFYRNGIEIASTALGGSYAQLDANSQFTIGSIPDLEEYFSGDIALAAVWDTALDATARADLHTYVQDTYGITVSDYSGGGGPTTVEPDEAAHAHTAETVALSQGYVLTVDDATHGQAADSPALSQAVTLASAGAAHGHTADSPALVQASVLAVDAGAHAHMVDPVALSQADILMPAAAAHAHSVESPALGVTGALSVAAGMHGHTADALTLTQAHQLVAHAALHQHTAGSPALSIGGVGPVIDYPTTLYIRRSLASTEHVRRSLASTETV